jgi:Aspartyl protease
VHSLVCVLFLFAIETLAGSDALFGENISEAHGYPLVATWINGQGPFSMLVDTGAAQCAIRPSLAVQLGLVSTHQHVLSTMSGQKMVPAARVTVHLASEVLEAEVLIYELPGIDQVDSSIDGLLGAGLLGQRPYIIDYRRHRFWFGDEARARAQPFRQTMPVKVSYGRPTVLVRTSSQAQPFRLVLDSGADHLILRCGKQCPTLLDTKTVAAVTNTGASQVQEGRLPLATIGSTRFSNVPCVVVPGSEDLEDGEGSLPSHLFSTIYVDTANGWVRFAR